MANFAFDLSSSYVVQPTLFGTTTGVSTDANAAGASVDLGPAVSNAFSAVLVVGTRTGTSPTLDMKIQESTDGSNNWTDCSNTAGSTATFTQVTTSNQSQTILVKPTKQYVRCTGTVGGTNPVFPTTVVVIAPRVTSPTNVGGWTTNASAS